MKNTSLVTEVVQLKQQINEDAEIVEKVEDEKEKEVEGEIEYLLKEIEGREN